MQTQSAPPPPATSTPVAPAPPAPVAGSQAVQGVTVVRGPQGTVQLPGGASPREMWQAARAERDELAELMTRLRNRRSDLAEQLRRPDVSGVDRNGLEQHLAEVDQRLIVMEKQMQVAEAKIAAAAGIPGAVRGTSEEQQASDYEDMIGVGMGLSFVLLVPVVFAYTRRLWKKANVVVAPVPAVVQERMSRMEQSLDAIAIEVERVSEGQRFLTKVFTEQRALGQGAAEPIELPAHETVARG